jgi:(4S)-4-hydroxy-5-phosphonooxypentane-2,3-dione isomerase
MPKFAVVATYEIAPEKIAAFLPLLFAHRDRCLAQEPGTLRFEVLQPDSNLMLYEVYENEAAFQAHRDGPLVARFREEAAAIERRLTFVTCRLLDGLPL